MEIILSEQCESLTGTLKRGLGYAIRKKNGGFYSVRCSNQRVPPSGHWRFIVLCAQLAQNRLHIADIRVKREELKQALYEAGCFIAMQHLRKDNYNARDILNLKTTFSL